jgi:hypothetical protein
VFSKATLSPKRVYFVVTLFTVFSVLIPASSYLKARLVEPLPRLFSCLPFSQV